jgi:hypothetical protein
MKGYRLGTLFPIIGLTPLNFWSSDSTESNIETIEEEKEEEEEVASKYRSAL